MKNLYIAFYLIFFWLLFIESNAQKQYVVKRGERPPIDLQNVPEDAYEKDIVKIKLNEALTKQLDDQPVLIDADGHVRFNIEKIDELNNRFGATKFKRLFDSKAFSGEFEERHMAWGFHLWYKLYFDEKADIKEIVKAYSQLSEVTVAEPEYKKQLVISELELSDGDEKKKETGGPLIDWTPNDPSYGVQWHYNNTGQQSGTPDADIDLPEAWDIEPGNSNVVVCIEDMGVQYDHPDLSGNMWSGLGYDFYNDDATIEPGYHGTHVAGTVAAESNNGVGVSGVAGGSGSNDGVRLMSCQVFSSSGSGGGFELAPIYAADNGACISQNSWGYTSPNVYDEPVLDAIDYFNLNGGGSALDGGITIYAAGNSNSNGNYYPGYYSGTLAVAATNNQDIRSYYSNYGTWVDVSAPGGETNSVTARGVYSTYTGSSYNYLQGTSMACPHTSGVAALIISLAYGSLSAADVADILINTTDDIDALNPSYAGQLGSGRINAYQALLETQNYISGVLNPQTFTATAVSTSQINLAWTKNVSNNNVMVVWSSSGTFGTPTDGTVYSAGQTIPGGGTVLYRGSNTAYNHSSLNPATTYYYRAFSYNSSNEYSSGKNADATTFCDAISTLPFSENFGAGFLPTCWDIIDNQGNGQVWQIGTISGYSPNPALTGPYAYLNSDAYGSGNSQNSDLVSPLFDFSGYTSINISFSHYFRWYSPSTATFSYSINGGSSWTIIQSWTATTANPAAFNQIVAAVAGQSNVKFKWNYTGTWGYYWAVDDVNITGIQSGVAPSCTTPVTPTDGATSVGITTNLEWNAASGATGYYLYFGTDNPPTNIVNGTNQGNTTTYTPAASLDLNTTYFWKVVPFNSYGSATGCATWDFTTTATLCETVEIDILTDNYGSETTWELVDDETSTVLLSGGPYGNNTLYSETICLSHGCYTFTIYDAYGDGICCSYGSGYYTVTNLSTSEVYGTGGDFGYEESVAFCVTVGSSGEWMGGVSGSETDWQSAMNWGDGLVPASGINVVVPMSPMGGHFPETNSGSGAVCNNLTIESGAHLIVPANNTLTVNGTLTNNSGISGLVIKSTAEDATGSLIHSTNGVDATVERYLTDYMWHFIGMPIEAGYAGVFHLPAGHSDIYLRSHIESTNTWGPYIVPVITPLVQGKGYECWVGDPLGFHQDEVVKFEGTLNTGNYTTGTGGFYDLEYTSGHGLNLISNPYPSALQGNINTWTKSNIANSIWTWSDTYGNYVYWGTGNDYGGGNFGTMTGGVIPAMQAFFVEATGSNPYLTIPQSDRIHSTQPYYKETELLNTVQLDVRGNGYKDVIFVRFDELATNEYDKDFDIRKLYGLDEAPQIYSIIQGANLSVNTLEPTDKYTFVNIGFECAIPELFTINGKNMESFEDGIELFLEDKNENIIQNLKENPEYVFVHDPLNDPGRFVLHFGTPNDITEVNNPKIRIYSYADQVYVQTPEMRSGEIVIYNIMGEEILRKQVEKSGQTVIRLTSGTGYYLVQVQTENKLKTEKVFIK
ncbi:MAG: S8 family serine peptidase [Bacteroidales bacterium]|nr:S8 family serine peptidase [Bacteroidales bacterium]